MQELEAEPLFVAITRPALIWGVPLEAFCLSAIVATGISFCATGALAAFVPIWVVVLGVCKIISARDPLIFVEWFSWLSALPLTWPRSPNSTWGYWGCLSMSPLTVAPLRRDREP